MKYKLIIRISAIFMALSGLTILTTTVFPIIAYEWESGKNFPMLVSSLPDNSGVQEGSEDTDFTKASTWFKDSNSHFNNAEISYFTVSVPKLRIDNASVAIGGEDLAKSLIQYPGTALPGKTGNAVIFGHSVLPQFFNPKDYMTIFSTLHTLKKDDKIIANYDGVMYTYQVETMFEVKPTDLQILEQSKGHSYLTLVTCSPPGNPFKPKRLIVRAKLIPQTTASVN